MRFLRPCSRLGVSFATVIPLLCAVACAHESRGVIEGELTYAEPRGTSAPADISPTTRHEQVRFTWQSSDGGLSGRIQAPLPDGEVFQGKWQEVTSMLADRSGGFCGGWGHGGGYRRGYGGWYGGWYGGPWMGPGWGGAWPYHGSCDGYVTYYSGQVVAVLEGDRGTKMRCHFTLDESGSGIAGGGFGECQLSNGDRITAMFDRSDATTEPLG